MLLCFPVPLLGISVPSLSCWQLSVCIESIPLGEGINHLGEKPGYFLGAPKIHLPSLSPGCTEGTALPTKKRWSSGTEEPLRSFWGTPRLCHVPLLVSWDGSKYPQGSSIEEQFWMSLCLCPSWVSVDLSGATPGQTWF